jgi:NADPH-dependent 2,4-dienoyl-CoA reductase/sulfur reductase-like enzyme
MTVRSLDLVIVGNGAAAAEAALAVRAAGHRGDLDLFADNALPPYNPMLGTYFASGAITAGQCFPFGGMEFHERAGIAAHLETPVAHLDPSRRLLTTAEGRQYTYRRCLVASGARTVVPPAPGLDAPGVLSLRTFADAEQLKAIIADVVARAAGENRPPRGLVLGASFAGLEVAAVLQRAGMEVSIVEREEHVLPLAAHAECASVIETHLRGLGYELELGTELERVTRPDGHLRAHLRARKPVAVDDAATPHERDADLLVVCTGSRPSLAFIAPGTVVTAAGLLVDEHLQTSSPGLYAAGDVAQAPDPVTGAREIVARWANARRQGRTAGLAMAGAHAENPGSIACNVQHVGELLFATAGSVREYDKLEVVSRGSGLTVWAFLDGRLAGANIVGSAPESGPLVSALARRLAAGVPPAGSAAEWAKRVTWTSWNAS